MLIKLMFINNEIFTIISFLIIFGTIYLKIKETMFLKCKETSKLIFFEIKQLYKLKYYLNYNNIKNNKEFFKIIKYFYKNIFIILKKLYKNFIINYLHLKNKIFIKYIGIIQCNSSITFTLNQFQKLNTKHLLISQRELNSALKYISNKINKKW